MSNQSLTHHARNAMMPSSSNANVVGSLSQSEALSKSAAARRSRSVSPMQSSGRRDNTIVRSRSATDLRNAGQQAAATRTTGRRGGYRPSIGTPVSQRRSTHGGDSNLALKRSYSNPNVGIIPWYVGPNTPGYKADASGYGYRRSHSPNARPNARVVPAFGGAGASEDALGEPEFEELSKSKSKERENLDIVPVDTVARLAQPQRDGFDGDTLHRAEPARSGPVKLRNNALRVVDTLDRLRKGEGVSDAVMKKLAGVADITRISQHIGTSDQPLFPYGDDSNYPTIDGSRPSFEWNGSMEYQLATARNHYFNGKYEYGNEVHVRVSPLEKSSKDIYDNNIELVQVDKHGSVSSIARCRLAIHEIERRLNAVTRGVQSGMGVVVDEHLAESPTVIVHGRRFVNELLVEVYYLISAYNTMASELDFYCDCESLQEDVGYLQALISAMHRIYQLLRYIDTKCNENSSSRDSDYRDLTILLNGQLGKYTSPSDEDVLYKDTFATKLLRTTLHLCRKAAIKADIIMDKMAGAPILKDPNEFSYPTQIGKPSFQYNSSVKILQDIVLKYI